MAAITTVTSDAAWSPDVSTFSPGDVIPDALILATSTIAGSVEGDEPAVRVAWADDAAAGFVAEGATITESDPGLSEIVVHTGKVAQLVRVSSEQWSQVNSAEMLSQSVARAVTKAANAAYIAQAAPTAPAVTPPAGLLNIAGITDGGTLGANLDILIDAIASIEDAGGEATHILAAPATWADLSKLKAATGSNLPLVADPGAPATEAAVRRLLGVPVLVSPAVTADTLLVIDSTAIASVVGDVKVATSEHRYFESDAIALRCTWRFGANVVHPDRIVSIATA